MSPSSAQYRNELQRTIEYKENMAEVIECFPSAVFRYAGEGYAIGDGVAANLHGLWLAGGAAAGLLSRVADHDERELGEMQGAIIKIKALCSALVVLAHTLTGDDPEGAGVSIVMQLDAMGWLACGIADAVEKLEQLVA